MHSKIHSILQNTLQNFRYNIKPMILFEIFYQLLAVAILIPINDLILTVAMQSKGDFSISNTDWLSFIFTIEGATSLTIIGIISALAIFIEISVLTYMANKSNQKQSVTLTEASINSMRLLPKIMNPYIILMIILAGIIGPLTGIGLYNSLIKKLNIPSFITIELFKSTGGKLLVVAFIFIIITTLLHWFFSIPAFIIEDISLKKAFKNSRQLFKSNKLQTLFSILFWIFSNVIFKGFLLVLYLFIGRQIIMLLNPLYNTTQIVMIIYLFLLVISYVFISLLTLPLFISFLVENYYRYRDYPAKERTFNSIQSYEKRNPLFFIRSYHQHLTLTLLLIFCFLVGFKGDSIISNPGVQHRIFITAHRGSSLKAPENSLSSVKQAIKEEADFVEIDVMTTKDNQVVLFHDSNLKRIDGTNRKIKDMLLEEVLRVDNGSYFSPLFSDEKIPTLQDIFKLTKNKIKLNIELKPTSQTDALPIEVAKLIQQYDMVDQVVVSSLDYTTLETFNFHLPEVKIGYILTLGFGDYTLLNVDFVSVEYQQLSRELVSSMHALQKEVHVWTINNKQQAAGAIKLKVDNIITDNVILIHESISQSILYDRDYLTWFYDRVVAILRYIKI